MHAFPHIAKMEYVVLSVHACTHWFVAKPAKIWLSSELNFYIVLVTQTAQLGVTSQFYYCFDSRDAVHKHKLHLCLIS